MAQKTMTGVDWLTATSKSDKIGAVWYSLFTAQARKLKHEEPVVDWRNRWYSGRKVGKLIWGHSDRQGYCLIAQGAVAMDLWQDIRPVRSKITRIDLQVTVDTDKADPNLLERYEGQIAQVDRVGSTYWRKSRGGKTLYCGSRNSDHFGRIYDKGAQLGAPADRLWRYEVQSNGKVAPALANLLAAETSDDLASFITRYVHSWFCLRGVTPPFLPGGKAPLMSVGSEVTTVERKIEWLRSQVAPTLALLENLGRLHDGLRALGLTSDLDLVDVNTGVLYGQTEARNNGNNNAGNERSNGRQTKAITR